AAALAAHQQHHRLPRLHPSHFTRERRGTADRRPADAQHHVAGHQAGLAGRIALHPGDAHALAGLQAKLATLGIGQLLGDQAERVGVARRGRCGRARARGTACERVVLELGQGHVERAFAAFAEHHDLIFAPGTLLPTIGGRSPGCRTVTPSALRITSPGSMPTFSAGLPGTTSLTSAPSVSGRPKPLAWSAVMPVAWNCTPSWPRCTRPVFFSWSTTFMATSIGIAKATPM